MIRLNKTKNSKYIIYVGWALQFFADTYSDAVDVLRQYGNESCTIQSI